MSTKKIRFLIERCKHGGSPTHATLREALAEVEAIEKAAAECDPDGEGPSNATVELFRAIAKESGK